MLIIILFSDSYTASLNIALMDLTKKVNQSVKKLSSNQLQVLEKIINAGRRACLAA